MATLIRPIQKDYSTIFIKLSKQQNALLDGYMNKLLQNPGKMAILGQYDDKQKGVKMHLLDIETTKKIAEVITNNYPKRF